MSGKWRAALFAVCVLVLPGCDAGRAGDADKGVMKIGVELPLSGQDAANGLPTLNGVKYAVQKRPRIKGFSIQVDALDDSVDGIHNPDKGNQNVRSFVGDATVLGFVGPFNAGVAQAEIPVANRAHLTMISPANADQCLTKDRPAPECSYRAADLRAAPNNYFRVVATDDLESLAMADYAVETLGLKKVAVGSDGQGPAKSNADRFSTELASKGGDPTPRLDFTIKTPEALAPFESGASRANAGGLFFGGSASDRVCIARQQMKITNLVGPFMGGAEIATAQCIDDAADNVDGMYAAVAAVDATRLPEAQASITDFRKSFAGPRDFGAYTMPAYDSANVLLDAVSQAVDDAHGGMPSREQVRARVAATKDFQGTLGKTSFDGNGDTTNRIISIYSIGQAPGITGASPKDWVWAAHMRV